MITKLNSDPQLPARVVLLGSSGFIGNALHNSLNAKKVPTLPICSAQVDLSNPIQTTKFLNANLRSSDVIVFLAIIGPNKSNPAQNILQNLQMALNLEAFLRTKSCQQLIYISSDAVFAAEAAIVQHDTQPNPQSAYGITHYMRETLLAKNIANDMPLLILRPTQIYGAHCTHNAYGPCRFLRSAQSRKVIELFGNGEEQRDFVYIKDLVTIIENCILYKLSGIANVATGNSITYRELAQTVKSIIGDESVNITSVARQQEITHRHFNISALAAVLPNLSFTSLQQGLQAMYEQELCNV